MLTDDKKRKMLGAVLGDNAPCSIAPDSLTNAIQSTTFDSSAAVEDAQKLAQLQAEAEKTQAMQAAAEVALQAEMSQEQLQSEYEKYLAQRKDWGGV